MNNRRGRLRRSRQVNRVFHVVLFILFLILGVREVSRRFDDSTEPEQEGISASHIFEDADRIADPEKDRNVEEPLPQVMLPASMDGYLAADCLDVGQGDCTLIRQGSHAMLFDCGGQLPVRIRKYLQDEDIRDLEMVWLSHPDSDHIGAFPAVSYDLKIGRLYWNGEEKDTFAFSQMIRTASERGIPMTVPSPGEEIFLGDASITVLGPLQSDEENSNNNSLAIRIVYGDTSFLFCGDAEKEEETDLLESGAKLKSDVLHVSHHGSNSSSMAKFLESVRPSFAVISCGAENDYDHPGKWALKRIGESGANILRTDRSGTIRILSDGNSLKVGSI